MKTIPISLDAFDPTAPGSVVRDAAQAAPAQSNGGGTAIALPQQAEVAEASRKV